MNRCASEVLRGTFAASMLAVVIGLSGCASTVSARVTSFQHWPGNAAGQAYRFAPVEANNLEQRAYQDVVRASIGATGLVEAPPGGAARFEVAFDYGVAQVQVMTRRPYDPYFYGGYGGYGRFAGPYGRFWGPGFGWGGYWGPEWVDVPVTAYRNTVNLRISDAAQGGAEVYRATASTLSDRPDLIRVMPYLMQSVFDNFPNNNGTDREIDYSVQ